MESNTLILVVPREKLFQGKEFQGFIPHTNESDYEQRILLNSFFHPRQEAEHNPSLKQPIGYCIIYNPSLGKVFLYKRAKKSSDYKEKRLQGKYSIGIGGHIDEIDSTDKAKNPIRLSIARELSEEIGLTSCDPVILGYINDDKNDVGSVHFGLLYLVSTDIKEIVPNSGEITECSFKTLSELEELVRASKSQQGIEIETWSSIAIEHLSALIKN